MGGKLGAVHHFWGGELHLRLAQCGLAEAHLHAKCRLDPSSRLATIDVGENWGLHPLFGGELGPHLTQSPGPRSTSIPSDILIHPAIWPQQIWAIIGGLCPFGGGEAGSPSNNVARAEAYPHAKFHLDPSDRLATVHQCHRQEKTDNFPIAYAVYTVNHFTKKVAQKLQTLSAEIGSRTV